MNELVTKFANGKPCFVVCWDGKPQLITTYDSATSLCDSKGGDCEVWQVYCFSGWTVATPVYRIN